MIIGLGIDLVDVQRIRDIWSRFDLKFAEKILTQEELHLLPKNPINYLASRFAAKEAGVKALGTGFGQGISFKSLCVERQKSGAPKLIFKNQALAVAQHLQVKNSHLSLSHTRQGAVAIVILEK